MILPQVHLGSPRLEGFLLFFDTLQTACPIVCRMLHQIFAVCLVIANAAAPALATNMA